MSDKDDDGDSGAIGLANSRSKRDKSKKVTNRLAALAALKATRESGKKHLAEVDDFKVSKNYDSPYQRFSKMFNNFSAKLINF